MVTHAAISKLASAIFNGNTRRIDNSLDSKRRAGRGHDRA
jgi:hypothetical protein